MSGHAQLRKHIIEEPDGSGFYPCTAEDFELAYERVSP